MLQLTPAEATLIVAAVSLASAFLGWLGRGLIFLLRRWWTGAPQQERATYLNSLADLAAKLRTTGMTIDDVRKIESIMHSPAVAGSTAANIVVKGLTQDAEGPAIFNSNVALKARSGAAYGVANAQLEQALMDLRLLVSDREYEAVEAVQERWREYRRALEDHALRQYEGGTHATLALVMAGLGETERRTKEIRAQVAELVERRG